MSHFLSGAAMMAFLIAGLFFTRFWVHTRDRLFAIFAVAFFLLCAERWFLVFIDMESEIRTWVFFIRLLAFIMIIYGVVDKNRATKPSH